MSLLTGVCLAVEDNAGHSLYYGGSGLCEKRETTWRYAQKFTIIIPLETGSW